MMTDNYIKMNESLEKELVELIGASSTCYYNNGLIINGVSGYLHNIEAAMQLIHSDKIFWKLSFEYFGETGSEHKVVRIVDENDNELAYQDGIHNTHSIPTLMCMAYRDMLKQTNKEEMV